MVSRRSKRIFKISEISIEKGLKEEEVLDVLQIAYNTIKGEYGE